MAPFYSGDHDLIYTKKESFHKNFTFSSKKKIELYFEGFLDMSIHHYVKKSTIFVNVPYSLDHNLNKRKLTVSDVAT